MATHHNFAGAGGPVVEPLPNVIYDEMIDELTDGDDSNRIDRIEYWKMILLKREYIFNKSDSTLRLWPTLQLRWPTAADRWATLRTNLRRAVRLGDKKWLERGADVYAQVDLWLIKQGLEEWLGAKGRY